MAEYPSNSNKSKNEIKMRDPVVKNVPTVGKQVTTEEKEKDGLLRMIFAQDFKDIKKGLIEQWIQPQVKNLAWNYIQFLIDTVKNGVKMMMYDNYRPTEKSNSPASTYTYSNYYQPSVATQSTTKHQSNTDTINYDEFEYPTEKEARDVLQELRNLIEISKAASVLDLYGFSKMSTANYALQNWGWTNLDHADVVQTVSDDGRVVYVITLPKAQMLPR